MRVGRDSKFHIMKLLFHHSDQPHHGLSYYLLGACVIVLGLL